MHHYYTHQGHINKHGNDSQAFFFAITNKIEYGMAVTTSSYIYTSSNDKLCITTIHIKATLINMVMIHGLFSSVSHIIMIKVLTFNSNIHHGGLFVLLYGLFVFTNSSRYISSIDIIINQYHL